MTDPLCQLAQDWRGTLPPAGAAFEEKIDGWRALYFRGLDGQPRLFTRNGRRIEGAAHIIHRLGLLERVACQPLFVDGEFQVDGSLAATKAWCERGWKQGGAAGTFHAFDIVPMVNWVQGHWDWPWHRRKAWLTSLARQADTDPALHWEWRQGSFGADDGGQSVTVLPDSWAFDAGDAIAEANRFWAAGREGLVLKDAEAPYQRNRNPAWLKVKQGGPWQKGAATPYRAFQTGELR